MHQLALGLTLALFASFAARDADALVVMDSEGNEYDLELVTDSFFNLSDELTSQPWWGDVSLARDLAIALGSQLGLPNGNGNQGPNFARLQDSSGVIAENWFPSGPSVVSAFLQKGLVTNFVVVVPEPGAGSVGTAAVSCVALLARGRRRAQCNVRVR
jgi:hypothetical protein